MLRGTLAYLYFYLGYFQVTEKNRLLLHFEIEKWRELRNLGRLDFFNLMKQDENHEKVMSEIDKVHATSVYDHPSEDCLDARNVVRKFFFLLATSVYLML